MTWRERTLEGTFRGVPFRLRSASAQDGRRVASHEVPFRPDAIHQDMGRAAGTFEVTCAVLGPEYMDARDALRAALVEPGPGILVLPTLGSHRVVAAGHKLTESTQEGGVAVFTISFRRAEAPEGQATPRSALVRRVGKFATALEDVALADFERTLQTEGVPGWTLDGVVGEITKVMDVLTNLGLGSEGALAADLAHKARKLADGALGRLANPSGLGKDVQDLIQGFESGFSSRITAYNALRGLMGQEPSVSRGISSMQLVAFDNAQAVQTLTSATAGARAAVAAADAPWPSRKDAQAALDELRRLFEALRATASDEVILELDTLEAGLAAVLPPPESVLPRLEELVLGATEPSLVLSHRLYGTPDRADELAVRNRVRHPGFMPAGQPLEVPARA